MATASGSQEPRCVNCGEAGHWAMACFNERVERPLVTAPKDQAQNSAAWNGNNENTNGSPHRNKGHHESRHGRRGKGMLVTKYAPPPPIPAPAVQPGYSAPFPPVPYPTPPFQPSPGQSHHPYTAQYGPPATHPYPAPAPSQGPPTQGPPPQGPPQPLHPLGPPPPRSAPPHGYQVPPPMPPHFPPAPGSYGAPPPPPPPSAAHAFPPPPSATHSFPPPPPPAPTGPSGVVPRPPFSASFPPGPNGVLVSGPPIHHPPPPPTQHGSAPYGSDPYSALVTSTFTPPPPYGQTAGLYGPPSGPYGPSSTLPNPVAQGFYAPVSAGDGGGDARPVSRASSAQALHHGRAEPTPLSGQSRRHDPRYRTNRPKHDARKPSHNHNTQPGRTPSARVPGPPLETLLPLPASPVPPAPPAPPSEAPSERPPVSSSETAAKATPGDGTGPGGRSERADKTPVLADASQGDSAAPKRTTEKRKEKNLFTESERWDEKYIFQEPKEIRVDETAIPLGSVYCDDILLPPKYGVERTQAKHFTPENLDTFIKPIRETSHWPDFEYDPVFVTNGKFPNGLAATMANVPKHLIFQPAGPSRKHARDEPAEEGEVESGDEGRRHKMAKRGLVPGNDGPNGEQDKSRRHDRGNGDGDERDLKHRRFGHLDPRNIAESSSPRVTSRPPDPRSSHHPHLRPSSPTRSQSSSTTGERAGAGLLPPAPSSLPARPPVRPPSPIGSAYSARRPGSRQDSRYDSRYDDDRRHGDYRRDYRRDGDYRGDDGRGDRRRDENHWPARTYRHDEDYTHDGSYRRDEDYRRDGSYRRGDDGRRDDSRHRDEKRHEVRRNHSYDAEQDRRETRRRRRDSSVDAGSSPQLKSLEAGPRHKQRSQSRGPSPSPSSADDPSSESDPEDLEDWEYIILGICKKEKSKKGRPKTDSNTKSSPNADAGKRDTPKKGGITKMGRAKKKPAVSSAYDRRW